MLTEELPRREPAPVVLPLVILEGDSLPEVVRSLVRQARRPLLKRPSAAIVVLAPLTEEAEERRETKASRRQETRPAEPSVFGHLRESSVRPATAAEYHAIYEAYLQPVLKPAGFHLEVTAEAVDDMVAETMEELFYERMAPSVGQKLKAALFFAHPVLKSGGPRCLPKSVQAFKGWRKFDPPRSRLPLCLEALAFILDRLLVNGFFEEVLVTALAVHAYLRPSEALRILARVLPTGSIAAWGLTLHPYEGRHPSKTEVFGEAFLVGEMGVMKEVATPLGQPALLRAQVSPHAKLFTTTQAQWRRRFLKAAAEIGFPHVMLYQLRQRRQPRHGSPVPEHPAGPAARQVGGIQFGAAVREGRKAGGAGQPARPSLPTRQPGAPAAGHHAGRSSHAAVLSGVRRDRRERRAPRRSAVPLLGDMMKERMPRLAKRALEIGPLRSLRVKYFLGIYVLGPLSISAGTGRLGPLCSGVGRIRSSSTSSSVPRTTSPRSPYRYLSEAGSRQASSRLSILASHATAFPEPATDAWARPR